MTKFCFYIAVSTLKFFSAVLISRRGKGWHVNWVAEIKNCLKHVSGDIMK